MIGLVSVLGIYLEVVVSIQTLVAVQKQQNHSAKYRTTGRPREWNSSMAIRLSAEFEKRLGAWRRWRGRHNGDMEWGLDQFDFTGDAFRVLSTNTR
jgi:hypothetical protein